MKFPKGFLEMLKRNDKKIYEVLAKYADHFEFEMSLPYNSISSNLGSGEPDYIMLLDGTVIRGKIINVVNDHVIIKRSGFALIEEDLVDKNIRQYQDLLNKAKELDALKKSIETIKGVLK